MPLVSVLMPAYNAEKYIGEAIESILNQTFKDFELIIINDGSKDKTEEIIEEYAKKDNRIVYVKNDKNMKISQTLNRGMDMANGKYIARMDTDDISLEDRFEKQVKYMEENPDCGVIGTCFLSFRDEDKTNTMKNIRPETDHIIRLHGLYCCQFAHPTVMMRKSFFDENNLRYNPKYDGCEDFELWTRAKRFMKFHNLPEFLLYYRLHGENISIKSHGKQFMLSNKIYDAALREIIDEDFNIPLFTKLSFTLPEVKDSFDVLGEIPLMKLKENCPFNRKEISYACGMHMKNVVDRINLPNDYLASVAPNGVKVG